MRIFTLVLLLCGHSVIAQLQLKPLSYSNAQKPQEVLFPSSIESDTVLTIPFWDDFSTALGIPDTNLWEFGTTVRVNNTLSDNAPTKNVVTFDGLNELGRPHNADSRFLGIADSLVSRPIDLSQIKSLKKSTVYLSFYWQVRGKGDIPEEKDSLRLQFMRADSTWTTRWVIRGGIDQVKDEFTQEIIPLLSDDYFHANFRFKFQSFNSLKGVFDMWHIDYVYLDEDRDDEDIEYKDRSLSSPITSLFSPYSEVPASQFYANPNRYFTFQSTTATNLDNSLHPLVYTQEIVNTINDEVIYFSEFGNQPPHEPFEIREIFGGDITYDPAEVYDSTVLESTFIYQSGDTTLYGANLKVNDTLKAQYPVHQYYAYDDGSAEVVAGIDLNTGKIAVQFVMETPDTLTHIKMHFPSTEPPSVGQSIELTIWSSLEPEVVRHTQPYVIQSAGVDIFEEVQLAQSIIVSDTFYVGYQQFTDNYIGVGFDKNNEVAYNRIFVNTNLSWEANERLIGVLMIRPGFKSSSEFTLGIKPQEQSFTLFPNPGNGTFSIREDYQYLEVMDLSGSLLTREDARTQHHLNLSKGLYLVRIVNEKGSSIQRLIIR